METAIGSPTSIRTGWRCRKSDNHTTFSPSPHVANLPELLRQVGVRHEVQPVLCKGLLFRLLSDLELGGYLFLPEGIREPWVGEFGFQGLHISFIEFVGWQVVGEDVRRGDTHELRSRCGKVVGDVCGLDGPVGNGSEDSVGPRVPIREEHLH